MQNDGKKGDTKDTNANTGSSERNITNGDDAKNRYKDTKDTNLADKEKILLKDISVSKVPKPSQNPPQSHITNGVDTKNTKDTKDTNLADKEKILLKDIPVSKDPKPSQNPPQIHVEPRKPSLNIVVQPVQNDAPAINNPSREVGDAVRTETKSVGGKMPKKEGPKIDLSLTKVVSMSSCLDWPKAAYFVLILRYLFQNISLI